MFRNISSVAQHKCNLRAPRLHQDTIFTITEKIKQKKITKNKMNNKKDRRPHFWMGGVNRIGQYGLPNSYST